MDAKKYHHRNFQQVRIGVNANFKSDLIYVNLTILLGLIRKNEKIRKYMVETGHSPISQIMAGLAVLVSW
jgi:hypothetical protein